MVKYTPDAKTIIQLAQYSLQGMHRAKSMWWLPDGSLAGTEMDNMDSWTVEGYVDAAGGQAHK